MSTSSSEGTIWRNENQQLQLPEHSKRSPYRENVAGRNSYTSTPSLPQTEFIYCIEERYNYRLRWYRQITIEVLARLESDRVAGP